MYKRQVPEAAGAGEVFPAVGEPDPHPLGGDGAHLIDALLLSLIHILTLPTSDLV